jgi:alpha-galactosidase
LNLIQIDDGYQKAVGDWLETRPAFNGQMGLLASEIRENGFRPGLWMAPFIVHPSSAIYREHPDWLLRDKNGKPANAGWNWNRFCGGLDLTHMEVQEYIRQVIHTAVYEWGYSYLKLDFLYAGALDGIRVDPTLTRAQVLRRGMELIREVAGPQTYLLGCGAPLGPMLGLVDGMRIGTDVAPDWDPKYFGIELLFPDEPDIPSAKNAMQNVLTRSMLHNRWWQNDPDCLLIRESSHLTLTEIQSMASIIAMSGGLMLLSDDMDEVSRYRLRIAQVLLPVIGKRPLVIDWADEVHPHLTRLDLENQTGVWHLLGYTNWENRPIKRSLHLSDFRLPSSGRWILRSFWKEKVLVSEGGSFEVNVPPHGTVLLAARKFTPDQPIYAGSNLHISQGLEVTRWEYQEGDLSFSINLPAKLSGYCELFLPFEPHLTKIQNQAVNFKRLSGNHYRIDLDMVGKTAIQIQA